MYFKGYHVKKQLVTTEGRSLYRLSNWIKIRQAYNVRASNAQLGYYRQDMNGYREGQEKFDSTIGTFCDYFTFCGKKYPIERFISCASPWGCLIAYEENEYTRYLSGYDSEEYRFPLLIEIDECGEYIRVYMEGSKIDEE